MTIAQQMQNIMQDIRMLVDDGYGDDEICIKLCNEHGLWVEETPGEQGYVPLWVDLLVVGMMEESEYGSDARPY